MAYQEIWEDLVFKLCFINGAELLCQIFAVVIALLHLTPSLNSQEFRISKDTVRLLTTIYYLILAFKSKSTNVYFTPLMNTIQFKKTNQTLGLFSIVIAWVLMNVTNCLYLGMVDGLAVDSGVIMFWSGLFMMIAWAIFVVLPLSKLDHSRNIFKPYVFPFVTGLYGIVVYAILVGSIFGISIDIFISLAFLAGVIFGLSYSNLIRVDKLLGFLYQRPYRKALFLLSPITILFLFLWLLPTVAPSIAFRFMPDEIRAEIVSETIPKYKVGDDFENLRNSLPSYFDNISASGNTARTMEHFAFVLQVQCGKIIRLKWARDHNIDLTIDGKLHDKPCP